MTNPTPPDPDESQAWERRVLMPLAVAVDLDEMIRVLRRIARGRPDNGRSLSGTQAQQLARIVLTALHRGW